jgi:suppressor for copper-sensitivity B
MKDGDIRHLAQLMLVFTLATLLVGMAWAQTDTPGGDTGGSLFGSGAGTENPVEIEAQFTVPQGNRTARLFITAKIQEGWHINSITQAKGGPIRTEIKLQPSDQYRLTGEFRVYPEPKKGKIPEAFGDLVLETHANKVTWHAPLEFSDGVDPAKLKIEGKVLVQPCNADTCYPPRDIPFSAVLGKEAKIPEEQLKTAVPAGASPQQPAGNSTTKGPKEPSAPAAAAPPLPVANPEQTPSAETGWKPFSLRKFKQLAGPAFNPQILQENLKNKQKNSHLGWELLLAFLGGITLNIMPCVLPVLGLKILAFVQQSGQSRVRTFLLNVWYSVGLIAVFMVLASLAASVKYNLGWGELFQFPTFNVVMSVIVFVMGLSFLGVWEIPIPGFIGSGKTAELAQREGFTGAFAKGVITTILATPCTGPFMASALAWSVSQPSLTIYLVFFSVGLGMASPYLIIGAFPKLVGFLPKPGAWMDTFKQVMGMVLLGTVVYIFSFLGTPYCLPTLGLLLGCGIGCWWIGRTPLTAGLPAQIRAWVVALVVVGIVWVIMFPGISGIGGGKERGTGLYGIMASRFDETIEKNTLRRLEELESQGFELVKTGRTEPVDAGPVKPKTILVDFTADWCVNCKTLEAFVLNTEAVRRKIAENGVVRLKADWTARNEPDVNQMLDWLGGRQVPTLAIFPANNSNNPIVLRGGYTKGDLLEELEKAGPSKK